METKKCLAWFEWIAGFGGAEDEMDDCWEGFRGLGTGSWDVDGGVDGEVDGEVGFGARLWEETKQKLEF